MNSAKQKLGRGEGRRPQRVKSWKTRMEKTAQGKSSEQALRKKRNAFKIFIWSSWRPKPI